MRSVLGLSQKLRMHYVVIDQRIWRTPCRKTPYRRGQHATDLEALREWFSREPGSRWYSACRCAPESSELATVSRVWPFETGLVRLPNREDRDCLIVLAEIYPSLVAVRTTPGGVKDALQVEATASHFAALDDAGELSTLFAGPDWLTADERVRVEREEGWTLGVTSRRPERIPSPPEQTVVMESCDATASEFGLPTSDFVYFATPACAPETITAEFVNSAKAIIAHAYNRFGQRMPLVRALRPGDQILLVYGSAGKYRPVFRCRVRAPEERVRLGIQRFDGILLHRRTTTRSIEIGRLRARSGDPAVRRNRNRVG